VTAAELAAAVGGELLRPGAGGSVRTVALALDPAGAPPPVDALVLHRFRGLGGTPPGLAVVGTHDWFDAQLPAWLAEALGVLAATPLAGDGRVLVGESADYGVVAVAGAMTDTLVRAAADAGAVLYVTGTWRAPASAAVAATGIDVLALGHERWERWGLHDLAARLRIRWPGVSFTAAA
jgi:hypothetical protein